MYERNNVSVKTVDTFETKPFTLKYFIISKGNCYGIEIEKHLLTSSGEAFEESESVGNITDEYSEIEFIAGKLANNYVTPTSLIEVLDDYISDR